MLRRVLRWLGAERLLGVDLSDYSRDDDDFIRDVQEAGRILVRRQDAVTAAMWRAREGIGRE